MPATNPESPAPKRRGFVLSPGLGAVLLAAVGGALLVFFVATSLGDDAGDEAPVQVASSDTQSGDAPGVAAGAVAQAGNNASTEGAADSPASLQGIDIVRLIVPGLEIDAPIVALGVDPDGTMQSPDNPTDVAWYNFSARPGELSNVVLAGHLDYANYGPAVFYRLRDAHPGDEVQLVLVDGSIARYRVQDVTAYDEATAPVLDIVGPTDGEVVTLITCGGSFDPLAREYDKRVVLRAERVSETAQGG